MNSYCVKCMASTTSVNSRLGVARNGRSMAISQCGRCGTKKTRFVSNASASAGKKKRKGAGFGDVLGSIARWVL